MKHVFLFLTAFFLLAGCHKEEEEEEQQEYNQINFFDSYNYICNVSFLNYTSETDYFVTIANRNNSNKINIGSFNDPIILYKNTNAQQMLNDFGIYREATNTHGMLNNKGVFYFYLYKGKHFIKQYELRPDKTTISVEITINKKGNIIYSDANY